MTFFWSTLFILFDKSWKTFPTILTKFQFPVWWLRPMWHRRCLNNSYILFPKFNFPVMAHDSWAKRISGKLIHGNVMSTLKILLVTTFIHIKPSFDPLTRIAELKIEFDPNKIKWIKMGFAFSKAIVLTINGSCFPLIFYLSLATCSSWIPYLRLACNFSKLAVITAVGICIK